MKSPYFTVVIDNYNYGRFIGECIDSILAQDFPPGEVETIVVDDGSTDNSVDVVRGYKDKVRLMVQKNSGQAGAFNTGMAAARGQVVALMDSDDYWEPDKLSVVADKMKDPDVHIIQHYLRDVDKDRRPMNNPLPDWPPSYSLADFAAGRFSNGATTSLAFRKAILDRIIPVPTQVFCLYDEYILDYGLLYADVYNIPRVLGYHRIHGGNNWAQGYRNPKKLAGSIKETHALLKYLEPQLASRALSFSPHYLASIDMEMKRREILLAMHDGDRASAFKHWLRLLRAHGGSSFGFFRCATCALALISPALYLRFYEIYSNNPWTAKARGRLLPDPVQSQRESSGD